MLLHNTPSSWLKSSIDELSRAPVILKEKDGHCNRTSPGHKIGGKGSNEKHDAYQSEKV